MGQNNGAAAEEAVFSRNYEKAWEAVGRLYEAEEGLVQAGQEYSDLRQKLVDEVPPKAMKAARTILRKAMDELVEARETVGRYSKIKGEGNPLHAKNITRKPKLKRPRRGDSSQDGGLGSYYTPVENRTQLELDGSRMRLQRTTKRRPAGYKREKAK